MTTAREAFLWSGSGAVLPMFVVTSMTTPLNITMVAGLCHPKRIRHYELEDDLGVLPGLHVYEYDAYFDDLPVDIAAYLRACLQEAKDGGACVAWFAFEGSFDFRTLLSPESAKYICAVMDSESIAISLEDEMRASDEWETHVSAARAQLIRLGMRTVV